MALIWVVPRCPLTPGFSTSEVRMYYVEKQTCRKTGTERQGEPGWYFFLFLFFIPMAREKGVNGEKRKQGEKETRETSRRRCTWWPLLPCSANTGQLLSHLDPRF